MYSALTFCNGVKIAVVLIFMTTYQYLAFQTIFHTTINFSWVYLRLRSMHFLKIASHKYQCHFPVISNNNYYYCCCYHSYVFGFMSVPEVVMRELVTPCLLCESCVRAHKDFKLLDK
jgi:hypothetical protein